MGIGLQIGQHLTLARDVFRDGGGAIVKWMPAPCFGKPLDQRFVAGSQKQGAHIDIEAREAAQVLRQVSQAAAGCGSAGVDRYRYIFVA